MKTNKTAYRFAAALALATASILGGLIGAVGVIGAEGEGQKAIGPGKGLLLVLRLNNAKNPSF